MGLSMGNSSRENIVRACMEAALYGMRLGLDSFRKLGMEASQITLTGGGAQSAVWRQMVADITGLPVSLPATHESAAFGAALQALWYHGLSAGAEKSIEAVAMGAVAGVADDSGSGSVGVGNLIRPGRDSPFYEEGYARYMEYLEAVKPLYMEEKI